MPAARNLLGIDKPRYIDFDLPTSAIAPDGMMQAERGLRLHRF